MKATDSADKIVNAVQFYCKGSDTHIGETLLGYVELLRRLNALMPSPREAVDVEDLANQHEREMKIAAMVDSTLERVGCAVCDPVFGCDTCDCPKHHDPDPFWEP